MTGFAAAGQRGQVIMSFDYDASDHPPTDKQQMEATWPHKDDMPYKEIRLNLPIAELTGPGGKYVRPGLPPTGTDIKTYDVGVLHIATSGMESLDAYIGELRVRSCADQYASYHVRNCASRPDEFIVGAKSMNEILEEYYTFGYLSCDTQAVRGDSAYDEIQPSGKNASFLSTDPSSD